MLDKLIACGINPTQARAVSEPLKAATALYSISTTDRLAAFLAQACIESSNFADFEENLYYTTPKRLREVFSKFKTVDPSSYVRNPKGLANLVYANRNGNGDEASGDGWRYRGQGIFQLTGKGNYVAAERGTGRPYVAHPELLREPSDAVLSACWYWQDRNCNALADAWNINAITRAINGNAMLHAKERLALANKFRKLL